MLSEFDSIFSRTWTAIGHVHNLPPSSATPVELMGIPMLLVKDPSGTIRVFHNICRHRGCQLVDDPCLIQGSIRCPYHSWNYDFDGCLKVTPNIGVIGIHYLEAFDIDSFCDMDEHSFYQSIGRWLVI